MYTSIDYRFHSSLVIIKGRETERYDCLFLPTKTCWCRDNWLFSSYLYAKWNDRKRLYSLLHQSYIIYLKAVPIVRWLTQQRNALGGFSSTQVYHYSLYLISIYSNYFFFPGHSSSSKCTRCIRREGLFA